MSKSNLKKNWAITWMPIAAGAVTAATLLGCTNSKSGAPASGQAGGAPQKMSVSTKHAEELAKAGKRAEASAEYTTLGEVTLQTPNADREARKGELLLVPEGIEYADEMFAKALEIDPTNAKANFYKAATEPVMLHKGLIPRYERLLSDDESQRGVEYVRMNIDKLHMPEVSNYAKKLPAGEKPFFTYHDFQRFQRERLLPALQASMERLNRIDLSKGPLKLNFTPERFRTEPARSSHYTYSSSYCRETANEGYKCDYYTYDYGHDEKSMRNEYNLDQHDLKAIRSGYQAMIDAVRVGTAYSIEDSELAIRQLRARDWIRRRDGAGGVTAQDVVETLNQFPGLLTLERDHQLTEVARSLPEVIRNGLELDELRDELCNNDARTLDNSVFTMMCISIEDVKNLHMALDVISGPSEVVLGRDDDNRPVRIVMDLSGTLNNPTRDIKALLPTSFDSHGRPTKYPDPTMGGLFPNGDVIEKFKLLGSSIKVRGVEKAVRKSVRSLKDHL